MLHPPGSLVVGGRLPHAWLTVCTPPPRGGERAAAAATAADNWLGTAEMESAGQSEFDLDPTVQSDAAAAAAAWKIVVSSLDLTEPCILDTYRAAAVEAFDGLGGVDGDSAVGSLSPSSTSSSSEVEEELVAATACDWSVETSSALPSQLAAVAATAALGERVPGTLINPID